jgi:hypothetical protein
MRVSHAHHQVLLVDNPIANPQGSWLAAESLKPEGTVQNNGGCFGRRQREQYLLNALELSAMLQQGLQDAPANLAAFPGCHVHAPNPSLITGLQPLLAIEASHPRRPFSNAPTTK